MTQPVADADDVRLEIDTFLEDDEIEKLIARTARDIYRAYDTDDFDDEDHRRDFEALLTALRIVERHDRAESSVDTGRSSIEYEASLIGALREGVRDLDPGDEFGSSVVRNTDRHVRSTGGS